MAEMFPGVSPLHRVEVAGARGRVQHRLGVELNRPGDVNIGMILLLNSPECWDLQLNVALSVFYNPLTKSYRTQAELDLPILCMVRDRYMLLKSVPVPVVGSCAHLLANFIQERTGHFPTI